MLFASSKYCLNCSISIWSAGTSKVNPEDTEKVNLDDKEFNGNVVSQFEGAFKLILSKLPVRSRIDPHGKRREHLVIPKVAIREALANAIVHRDYTTYSSRIDIADILLIQKLSIFSFSNL